MSNSEAADQKIHSFKRNMLSLNADVSSSTISALKSEHSILQASSFFNSVFHRCNFESVGMNACEFDGASKILQDASERWGLTPAFRFSSLAECRSDRVENAANSIVIGHDC